MAQIEQQTNDKLKIESDENNNLKMDTNEHKPSEDLNTDTIANVENKNNEEETKNNIEWICPQCTLQNKINILYCKVCKTKKPTYCWQWKNNYSDNWYQYPEHISIKIESAYSNGKSSMDFQLAHNEYSIDFIKLLQIDKSCNRSNQVKRVQYNDIKNNDKNRKVKHQISKTDIIGIVPVTLNVYKSTDVQVAYHTGVKVYDIEYSYGNGIVKNYVPSGWSFYKTVKICKNCRKTKENVNQIINYMKKTWKGQNYNITKNNCNHFSDAFIKQLCGEYFSIPSWINSLANMGSALEEITGSNVMDMFGTLATSFNSFNSNVK
eukprot:467024_1